MAAERIGTAQLLCWMVVNRITITLVYFPAMGRGALRHDVWLATLIGCALSVPCLWLIDRLLRRFPDRALPATLETVLGRPLGKVLTLVYTGSMLLGATTNLRLASEFFLAAFLPRTPAVVVLAVVAVLAAWAARAGVEVMGRASQVIFPMLVLSIVLIFLLLMKDIHFSELLPVMGQSGPLPVVQESVAVVSRNIEYIWLWFLVVQVEQPGRIFRTMTMGYLIMGVLWVLMAVSVSGILGGLQHEYFFPYFAATRLVSIADFLERVDAVVLGVWLFGVFLHTATYLWAAAVGAASLAGVPSFRPLVLPLTGLAVTYAFVVADSLPELRRYLDPEMLAPFTLLLVLGIPLFVLVVAAGRGLRGKAVR